MVLSRCSHRLVCNKILIIVVVIIVIVIIVVILITTVIIIVVVITIVVVVAIVVIIVRIWNSYVYVGSGIAYVHGGRIGIVGSPGYEPQCRNICRTYSPQPRSQSGFNRNKLAAAPYIHSRLRSREAPGCSIMLK